MTALAAAAPTSFERRSKTYTRPLLVGSAAGALYGAWAAYANWDHAATDVARAAATQFVLSFCSTTFLTLMIELVLARGRSRANRVVAALGPHALMVTLFVTLHTLAGTPNVVKTIAPSATVGLVFSGLYVWRASPRGAMTDELAPLIDAFFRCVSFEAGQRPDYAGIHALFIPGGQLIKNSLATPEISSVEQFIAPRQRLVDDGVLTAFVEYEIESLTQQFGNVAQRWSSYGKRGVQNGKAFEGRGVISTQLVRTPDGWRISAMAWDDERAGLPFPGALSGVASRR